MRSVRLLLAAVAFALPSFNVAAQEPWPLELVDPAAKDGAPADLLLPMPCGAAMAFQKVLVPVDPADPLTDAKVVVGQDGTENGFMEARRTDYLRGPFDAGADGTAYFIARYELTEGQYRALTGDCADPNRKDRIARGNITWLEAQQLADAYSRWLQQSAPGNLPRRGMALGFARLPTETEWEYAARGGAAVPPERYSALHFFDEGVLEDYAIFVAPGSSRGKVSAVGLKRPNALGLFDVYGNVEELMLEPYRLTLPGRTLGQPGGVVTRGGSAVSVSSQLYSAQRTEYTPYGANGGNTNSGVGLRFVLSAHIFSSDLFLDTVKSSWSQLAPCAADGTCPETAPDNIPLSDRGAADAPVADQPLLTETDARHLLQRTGFGAHPKEILTLTGLTRGQAIDRIMSLSPDFGTSWAGVPFAGDNVPPHWILNDLSKPEASAFLQTREAEAARLEDWWLAEMAASPRPQTERMVLFWHGLLQTDFEKVNGQVAALARQNRTLRAKGSGDLTALLRALLADAAMLRHYKADLNSLLTPDTTLAAFMLSLTGAPVSEADITNAARALTGLGVNDIKGLRPTFESWRHNEEPAVVLGVTLGGPDDLATLVAGHPGTAKTLARRLWQEIVGPDEPSEATLERILSRVGQDGPGYNTLLRAILEDGDFWAANARDALPRSPVDMLVSAVRSSGIPVADAGVLRSAAAALGEGLYLPTPPDAADTPEVRLRLMEDLFAAGRVMEAVEQPEGIPDSIFVRYAAEDLDGPPMFRVRLYKKDEYLRSVWVSEAIPAVGGVEEYPVISGNENWQIAEIAIPVDRDFDTIGVGFVNDACCGNGTGDRNLYIDWMQWGNRRFSARGAEIEGNCSQGKQVNGELYCNGTVLFERGKDSPLPVVGKLAKPPKAQLVAERVTLLWMTALQEDTRLAEAAIGLLHPRFGTFQAKAMVIRLRQRAGEQPELVLDPTLCDPACLPGDWPAAPSDVMVLPLATAGGGAEIYDRLSDDQRKLVGALWMSLPAILAEAGKSRPNEIAAALYRRVPKWQARLEQIWPAIQSSGHSEFIRAPSFMLMPLYEGPFTEAWEPIPVTRPGGQYALDPGDPARDAAIATVTASAFNLR
jgi:uncharacterized protein (DUF1800 family)